MKLYFTLNSWAKQQHKLVCRLIWFTFVNYNQTVILFKQCRMLQFQMRLHLAFSSCEFQTYKSTVSYLICKFLRPLNYQHDQTLAVKPVTQNLLLTLRAFCCLIRSLYFQSKRSFSVIVLHKVSYFSSFWALWIKELPPPLRIFTLYHTTCDPRPQNQS